MKILNYRLVNDVHIRQGLYYPLPYGQHDPVPMPSGSPVARGLSPVVTTHRAAFT